MARSHTARNIPAPITKAWITMAIPAFAFIGSLPAQARFLHTDADEVDREERYNTETYNDKWSYRFPSPWDTLWDQFASGYRVSAGSLNINRFNFVEEIKFEAARDQPVSFAFHQSRYEDVLEVRHEQRLRIDWWTQAGGLNLALLGEGGTYKQFGDLGAALGIKQDTSHIVELYHWSVDHYYNSKKDEEEDSRSQAAATSGLRGDWLFFDTWRLRFDVQVDKPFTWHRESQGYDYAYERQTLDLRLDVPLDEQLTSYVVSSLESKQEAKEFLNTGEATSKKSLSRHVANYRWGATFQPHHILWTGEIETLSRYANYEFWPTSAEESDLVETASPDEARRRELGLLLTAYNTKSHTQIGGHVSAVKIDEDGDIDQGVEAKLQTAWDVLLTDQARIFLNLTWDLDQVQRDFPYNEETFRPWGGGNIQFLAVF